jgi:hypothetical protein
MHRNIPTIFVILLLSVLILCTACLQSTDQRTQQNVGLAQVSEASSYISFDMARQDLAEYPHDPSNETYRVKTVYYIHGTDVDDSGNASSWLFGVRNSYRTELLAYNQNGWITIPWNAPPLSDEIDINRIVTPSSLFRQNNAVILSNPSQTNTERRDLELIQGIYTLTITSGSGNSILRFNATTGELIK